VLTTEMLTASLCVGILYTFCSSDF